MAREWHRPDASSATSDRTDLTDDAWRVSTRPVSRTPRFGSHVRSVDYTLVFSEPVFVACIDVGVHARSSVVDDASDSLRLRLRAAPLSARFVGGSGTRQLHFRADGDAIAIAEALLAEGDMDTNSPHANQWSLLLPALASSHIWHWKPNVARPRGHCARAHLVGADGRMATNDGRAQFEFGDFAAVLSDSLVHDERTGVEQDGVFSVALGSGSAQVCTSSLETKF